MADAAGWLIVGGVQKPHGIKGELFVRVETDHPAAVFAPGRVLRLGDANGNPVEGSLTIERARPFKGGLLVKTAELSGRDERLDALRGRSLLIPAGDAAPLAEDETFVHQLIGLRVLAAGEPVGVVREVYDAPGGWYLGVEREGKKELLLPFVREMVTRVDPAEGVVEVDPPAGLLEL
ncbi:ribosome maturation factor RimM [Longimicrobium sp.]|uniref:ribosome maturation factor RimM n=1 Tax=Longimicrobium sp. TaxID=2029185 RepID=UPI002C9D423F|nr:ribosome maturation factor RimM [Longimicrobium sp.]HSU15037.1 ribosome maturation factor RimM [Longimicrobium sp.]